jgi:hypothetical protein
VAKNSLSILDQVLYDGAVIESSVDTGRERSGELEMILGLIERDGVIGE